MIFFTIVIIILCGDKILNTRTKNVYFYRSRLAAVCYLMS